MANEGFFQLALSDVRGRPVNESKVKVGFRRVSENKTIMSATDLTFPGPHTFKVPAFPQAQNLICDVTPPRYRSRSSDIFTLTDGKTLVRNLTLFRLPDKWTANFIAWQQLSSHFQPLKDVLERSSAVKVKNGKLLGKLTAATYDGISKKEEVFAKAALLNLFAKLTDLIEPTGSEAPWFSFVKEIVEIGRERFIGLVDPKMGELVQTIKKNIGKFKDYENTIAQNHFGNIPAGFNVQKSKMFSIKSSEDHGNVQLTMAPGKDTAGKDVMILDADIDENGRMFQHLLDLFKHKVSGGTHPFDIHEFLALSSPNRPLGYELV